jgi:CCR4-NOT transcription complex subunit 2
LIPQNTRTPESPSQPLTGATNDHSDTEHEIEDPCTGMSDIDRFGLKGYFAMLNGPYTDQAALMTGMDLTALGLDLTSSEYVTNKLDEFEFLKLTWNRAMSDSIWSPFSDHLARPLVPKFSLPECYQVMNTAPIESKMSNLSDESLLVIFYTEPQSIRQMLAASEL